MSKIGRRVTPREAPLDDDFVVRRASQRTGGVDNTDQRFRSRGRYRRRAGELYKLAALARWDISNGIADHQVTEAVHRGQSRISLRMAGEAEQGKARRKNVCGVGTVVLVTCQNLLDIAGWKGIVAFGDDAGSGASYYGGDGGGDGSKSG